MRDAFGGAFLIKLFLIFLGIYVAFMAVALNYAKAFKVKNYIINVIEQYEGFKDSKTDEAIYTNINNYINGIGYNPAFDVTDLSSACINATNINGKAAYCIISLSSNEVRGTYYRVTTYMRFQLPFFGIDIKVPISGETRVVTGQNITA